VEKQVITVFSYFLFVLFMLLPLRIAALAQALKLELLN
jgi:hypothetical protein